MNLIKSKGDALNSKIPLMSSKARAGFPSPAEDYIERSINLHDELVHHPASTFFVRVSGDSMKDAGILEDDLLVIDRSLEPANGQIIMAILNGEFTVKYFYKTAQTIELVPANSNYPTILIRSEDEFEVWGVVTHAVHTLHKYFQ